MATKPTSALWQKIRKRLGTPVGADLATDVANIQTDTTAIAAKTYRAEFESISEFRSSTTSYTTVVEVTGSGILYDVAANANDPSTTVTVQLTIDGEVMAGASTAGDSTRGIQPSVDSGVLTYTAANGLWYSLNWEFQSGLKIEYKGSTTSGSLFIGAHYGHD